MKSNNLIHNYYLDCQALFFEAKKKFIQNQKSEAKNLLEECLKNSDSRFEYICQAIILLCYTYQELCIYNDTFTKFIKILPKIIADKFKNNIYTYSDPYPLSCLAISQDIIKQVSIQKALNYKGLIQNTLIMNKNKSTQKKDVRKIRIGYISFDFNLHSIGLQISEIINNHDNTKFDVYCYYLNNKYDYITDIIKTNSNYFKSLYEYNDFDSATIIANDQLDLLIDLGGYTKGARPQILAYHPAKYSCHYLGSMTTTGGLVDHFILDGYIADDKINHDFTENINMLKCSIFALKNKYNSKPSISKSELKIPNDKFIFACFTQPYRLDINSLNCFFQILNQVHSSVLWLYDMPIATKNNLINLAEKFNVKKNRFIFLEDNKLTNSFAHAYADLILDTLITSNATTSLLAIMAEVPVITLKGSSSQARSASSILYYSNLHECVTYSRQEYINLAIEIANNDELLKKIKLKISKNKNTLSIFNPKNLCHELEICYRSIISTGEKSDFCR